MHQTRIVGHLEKAVHVGGFQLGDLAVLQNVLNDGVVLFQLIQYLGRGGVARFGLLVGGEHESLEKDLAQLLGGIDVEGLARVGKDAALQIGGVGVQYQAVLVNGIAIHLEADALHIEEDGGQGHFHISEHAQLPGLFQLCDEGIAQGFVATDGISRESIAQISHGDTVRIKATQARIEGVGGQHDIEIRRREGNTVGGHAVVKILGVKGDGGDAVLGEECMDCVGRVGSHLTHTAGVELPFPAERQNSVFVGHGVAAEG